MFPGGTLDFVVGPLQLTANPFLRHLGEIGMRPTVAGDFVTFLGSPRENFRMLGYHFAEHKECRLDMMRSEYIEQFRRKHRAWSVIKRHSNVRSIDVHRIKRDWRFLGRNWSLYCSLLFRVWRCAGFRCRFDRLDGYCALRCRRGLGCERNSET